MALDISFAVTSEPAELKGGARGREGFEPYSRRLIRSLSLPVYFAFWGQFCGPGLSRTPVLQGPPVLTV